LGSIVHRYQEQNPGDYVGGARLNYAYKYDDLYDMHRTRLTLTGDSIATPLLTGKRSKASFRSFIAPSASVIGNVEIWDCASVWYNVVLKGDVNLIRIGAYVNIQDNTTICEAIAPLSLDHDGSTIIGHYTTVGHACKLQACTIEDECLVGLGSVLNEDSYMEKQSMLGAGSVLARGARVPTGELWVGNPAQFKRMLTDDEVADLRKSAQHYWKNASVHKQEFYLPVGTQYLEAEKLGYPVGWTEDFWGNKYPKEYVPPSKRNNNHQQQVKDNNQKPQPVDPTDPQRQQFEQQQQQQRQQEQQQHQPLQK